MAYLPEFANDIFISYRRVIDEGPDRWVQAFEAALRLQLKALVGDVVMWRDVEQIRTGDDWRQQLVVALEGAALYLAIISRTYLDSRECRNELDQMLAHLRDASKGPRKLFPIYKQPPRSESDVPPELQAVQRREFFARSPEAPLGFSELDAHPDDREFQQRLAWLAQEMTVALEALHDQSLQRLVGRVFVADVEHGLYRDRDNLVADLLNQRYRVVPEHEYLWHTGTIEEEIRVNLEEAKLAIHLVTPAGLQSEDEVAQARQQLVLAIEVMHKRALPPPVVWISSKTGANPLLQAFLQEIEGPFADQGVEVLIGGMEDLKSLVYKRLGPAPAPAAVVSDDVAVLVEDADLEAFGATRALLLEKFGVETVPVRLQGSSPHDLTAMTQALAACSRCLIFWGAQPEDWLQQVLRLAPLAPFFGERLCVLIADPPAVEKKLFVSKKAKIVRAGDAAGYGLGDFCGVKPKAPVQ